MKPALCWRGLLSVNTHHRDLVQVSVEEHVRGRLNVSHHAVMDAYKFASLE